MEKGKEGRTKPAQATGGRKGEEEDVVTELKIKANRKEVICRIRKKLSLRSLDVLGPEI